MDAPASTPNDPKELRPLLHAEIDRLPDEHLAAVRRLLLEVEVWHLMGSISEAADAARRAGKMTEESIRKPILKHPE